MCVAGMMSSLFRRGVTRPLVDTFETLCPRISPECRKDLQVGRTTHPVFSFGLHLYITTQAHNREHTSSRGP